MKRPRLTAAKLPATLAKQQSDFTSEGAPAPPPRPTPRALPAKPPRPPGGPASGRGWSGGRPPGQTR